MKELTKLWIGWLFLATIVGNDMYKFVFVVVGGALWVIDMWTPYIKRRK